MKCLKILVILLVSSSITFFSCSSDSSNDNARESLETTTPPPIPNANATPPPPKPAEPAQNAQGVWHYTCTKGCAGGAGSAVPCATCGATLVHNTAYHSNSSSPVLNNNTTTSTTSNPTSPIFNNNSNTTTSTPISPITSTPPKAPEPAQNAKGVWHYTCTKGCSGGAGSAIACASCGSTLVHNTAYHQ